jgi:hypothetical protein
MSGPELDRAYAFIMGMIFCFLLIFGLQALFG